MLEEPIKGTPLVKSFIDGEWVNPKGRGMVDEVFCDSVILNGNVITMNPRQPHAEAVAIKNGRIVRVGGNKKMIGLLTPKTKIWDIEGKTLIPGFIDAHQHLSLYGERYLLEDFGASNVSSIDDIKRLVAKRAGKGQQWVRAQGYDDTKISDKRLLNRWDLDTVAPDKPVFIKHIGGHLAVVNSEALRRANITEATPDPEGGTLGRDKSGRLNGVLYGNAAFMFTHQVGMRFPIIPPFSRQKRQKVIRKACEDFLSAGITSVHDALVSPEYIMSYQDVYNSGKLGVRVYMLIPHYFLRGLKDLGIYSGFGNDKLKVGAIKIILDGAISSRTAFLSEPFIGSKNDYGKVIIESQEELNKIVLEGHRLGFQFAIHANGDKAIEMALRAYRNALEKYPRKNHRHRIEHCTVVNPQLINEMRKLGIMAIPFGCFLWYHGEKVVPFYGMERAKLMFAHRAFLDAGIQIAGSSDSPAMPYNPLLAIQSCVTRQTSSGEVIAPEQRITVEEALRLYTLGGAYASFEESTKGTIEVGKLADLVVLSKDPTLVNPRTIMDINVMMTMVGGKVSFSKVN